jgi:hypothetical protein
MIRQRGPGAVQVRLSLSSPMPPRTPLDHTNHACKHHRIIHVMREGVVRNASSGYTTGLHKVKTNKTSVYLASGASVFTTDLRCVTCHAGLRVRSRAESASSQAYGTRHTTITITGQGWNGTGSEAGQPRLESVHADLKNDRLQQQSGSSLSILTLEQRILSSKCRSSVLLPSAERLQPSTTLTTAQMAGRPVEYTVSFDEFCPLHIINIHDSKPSLRRYALCVRRGGHAGVSRAWPSRRVQGLF